MVGSEINNGHLMLRIVVPVVQVGVEHLTGEV